MRVAGRCARKRPRGPHAQGIGTLRGVSAANQSPGSCRVVLCDDQKAFRDLLALLLGVEPGIEVVGEAANGLEAIDVALDQQPDVLLLDISMPELDGLSALPRIREAAPDTNVVMLTGLGAPALRERALAGGAVAYLEKGLDPGQIIDAIRSAHALR
jgi:two-component system, NarL family, response regulator DesR